MDTLFAFSAAFGFFFSCSWFVAFISRTQSPRSIGMLLCAIGLSFSTMVLYVIMAVLWKGKARATWSDLIWPSIPALLIMLFAYYNLTGGDEIWDVVLNLIAASCTILLYGIAVAKVTQVLTLERTYPLILVFIVAGTFLFLLGQVALSRPSLSTEGYGSATPIPLALTATAIQATLSAVEEIQGARTSGSAVPIPICGLEGIMPILRDNAWDGLGTIISILSTFCTTLILLLRVNTQRSKG